MTLAARAQKIAAESRKFEAWVARELDELRKDTSDEGRELAAIVAGIRNGVSSGASQLEDMKK